MCIAIPMQVTQAEPGRAWVQGRGERQRVDTALVGDCVPGDWLLVFLGTARERIDAARAAEVNGLLDLVEGAAHAGLDGADPGFALPSAMSADQMTALTSTSS
jgi:hydrogenase expression/formation protein HypC